MKRSNKHTNAHSPMIVTNHSVGELPTSTDMPSKGSFLSFCSSFFTRRSATLAVISVGLFRLFGVEIALLVLLQAFIISAHYPHLSSAVFRATSLW